MSEGLHDAVDIQHLEKRLHAKDKIISTLIARVEDMFNSSSLSAMALTHQNLVLETLVQKKTEELERERQKLEQTVTELKRTQSELIQAQKLVAIGQLAAGIAHEINTPLQYISDNILFINRAFSKLNDAIECARFMADSLPPELGRQLAELVRRGKLEYLMGEVPSAIEQSAEGLKRVTTIVAAMKEFSHPSGGQKQLVNIHSAIDSTITVARNVWKYVADIETEYTPEMPMIPCLRDEFNQVILNLLVNAADAISEVVCGGEKGKGTITIRTRITKDYAEIEVSDTGAGIPAEIQRRVFEPFFTTKPVGKGTGQGLAIARSVIVDKHNGKLSLSSEVGRGSTFTLSLPLRITEAEES